MNLEVGKLNTGESCFIHAGKGIDKEAVKRLANYLPKELQQGKILGKVTLVDCIKITPEFKEELLKEKKWFLKKSFFPRKLWVAIGRYSCF